MNQWPQDYSYYPVQYQAMPAQYQAQQWQSVFTVLMGVAMLVAMGACAFSLVRKAFKGEEVEFPL